MGLVDTVLRSRLGVFVCIPGVGRGITEFGVGAYHIIAVHAVGGIMALKLEHPVAVTGGLVTSLLGASNPIFDVVRPNDSLHPLPCAGRNAKLELGSARLHTTRSYLQN
jgi:hypothetical protein